MENSHPTKSSAYACLYPNIQGMEALKFIEEIGRTCYASMDKTTEDSAPDFVRGLIKRQHFAALEHVSFTIKFVCDRGVSHEIVRHRVASFMQESTRYVNYGTKFGGIRVIDPCFWNEEYQREMGLPVRENSDKLMELWYEAMESDNRIYNEMIALGATPQEARTVLPQSTRTTIFMTANIREWRHFFSLRGADTTGPAHPQMHEVCWDAFEQVKEHYPVFFDDIEMSCPKKR